MKRIEVKQILMMQASPNWETQIFKWSLLHLSTLTRQTDNKQRNLTSKKVINGCMKAVSPLASKALYHVFFLNCLYSCKPSESYAYSVRTRLKWYSTQNLSFKYKTPSHPSTLIDWKIGSHDGKSIVKNFSNCSCSRTVFTTVHPYSQSDPVFAKSEYTTLSQST